MMSDEVRLSTDHSATTARNDAPLPCAPRRASRGELPVLLLVLATALTFGRIVTFDFVHWDDNITTYANPQLNPPGWGSLRYFWTHLFWNLYMPVTWTVWTLTAMVAYLPDAPPGARALNPYVFHALSLATHVVAVLLVYRLLRQLRFAAWPACAGALVFALHPLQIEPVAWISSYNVVLCGALSVAAVGQYLRAAEAVDRARRRRRYAWATALFVLALLSKPMAVTVPFVVLAIGLLLLRRPWRRAAGAAGPWIAVAVGLAGFTAAWQGKNYSVQGWPLWTRPLVAADAVSFYLRKLVYPFGMAMDHGRTPMAALSDPGLLWKVLLPVVVLAIVWLLRDRARPLYAGLVIGVAGMLPVLGLAPFDFQQFSTVADRYAYLAMIGAAIAVAWATSRLPEAGRAGVCAVLAVVLGAATASQVVHWRDSHALFARATSVNPRSPLAWLNWGASLINDGRPQEAIDRLRRAIAILPTFHDARLNLGTALYDVGDVAAARRERQRLLALFPDSPMAHLAMGDLHNDSGDVTAAAASYRRALQLNPASDEARHKLARLAPPAPATTSPSEPLLE